MVTANDLLPPQPKELQEEYDPFFEATVLFEEAARHLDLEDHLEQRLKHAEREVTLHLPLVMDTGQVSTFTAYRVQHSTVRGPSLGGVRLSADVRLTDVQAAAMARTWECALLDLPFGGSAGAIGCDPARLSERELRHLVKDYTSGLGELIGPFQDVVTPDAGCNDLIMAWMADSYARLRGHAGPGGITGKPLVLGGLMDRSAAASQGVFLPLQEALTACGLPLQKQRIAIQGFGAVGLGVARLLFQAGARIVAISDISGGLLNEHGLDIPAVESFVQRQGMLLGYPEAEAVRNADVLEAASDVLILAAAERQLTTSNAERLQATIVLEGTRGAVTRSADRILDTRGLMVIPDLLGTAGVCIAAFLEWVQNVRYASVTPAEVEERLKGCVQAAYRATSEAARRYATSLRHAAHLIAVDRVAAALRLH